MTDLNFDLAPPAKMVDGLLAVPIDIQTITAHLVFDGSTSTATGDATVEFTTGPQAGNPIFDLRQTITSATLDGISVPVAHLAQHDFGGGLNAELRILESVLAAKTTHTLHLSYNLSLPLGSSTTISPPVPEWSSGPSLVWRSAFSDLNAARYLELWIPSNLIFDQFQLNLEISIQNTTIEHRLITNGNATSPGLNHWSISFPEYFTALSHLLEIRPSASVTSLSGSVTLSGTVVTIEVWKLSASSINLAAALANLQTWLAANESTVGPYLHGSRFIAILRDGGGGMEYSGGTTSAPDSLVLHHETFHSWWGRGLTPASQSDGWWDEAWTVYNNDEGGVGSLPFNFASSPITLAPRNSWVRATSGNAYTDGKRFFEGVAAEIGGPGVLNSLMHDFYLQHLGRPVSTMDIEEFVVSRTGHTQLVSAFHRFVYGLANSSPDLWLRDEIGHTGTEDWAGRFWHSPDLWVRRDDDGGLTHEDPLPGRDNYFYARVRNLAGSADARHFLVTFNVKSFAGTEFIYPNDFLPAIAAAADFELPPGESRIVSARWPAALVPPAGSYRCIVAAVLAQGDYPQEGRHVWEQNNLAQRNLTIASLGSGEWMIVPFVVANFNPRSEGRFWLEFVRTSAPVDMSASLLEPSTEAPLFESERLSIQDLLECGGRRPMQHSYNMAAWTSINRRTVAARGFRKSRQTIFEEKPRLRSCLLAPFSWALQGMGMKSRQQLQLPVTVGYKEQRLLGLGLKVPPSAKPGDTILVDLVKRDAVTNRILGGLAVQINVADRHT